MGFCFHMGDICWHIYKLLEIRANSDNQQGNSNKQFEVFVFQFAVKSRVFKGTLDLASTFVLLRIFCFMFKWQKVQKMGLFLLNLWAFFTLWPNASLTTMKMSESEFCLSPNLSWLFCTQNNISTVVSLAGCDSGLVVLILRDKMFLAYILKNVQGLNHLVIC